MIHPDALQDLNDRPADELREVMAHCAGLIAEKAGELSAINVTENLTAALRQLYTRSAAA